MNDLFLREKIRTRNLCNVVKTPGCRFVDVCGGEPRTYVDHTDDGFLPIFFLCSDPQQPTKQKGWSKIPSDLKEMNNQYYSSPGLCVTVLCCLMRYQIMVCIALGIFELGSG